MKKSELRQIIKEELENSLNKRNIYQELSDIVHDNEGNLGDITDAVYEWVNQNFTIKNKNLSESQELNPINKFFHELANEGEELVKKMKERNGNL